MRLDTPIVVPSRLTEHYRQDVEEWRVLEAEVRRRDEEAFNLGSFNILHFNIQFDDFYDYFHEFKTLMTGS